MKVLKDNWALLEVKITQLELEREEPKSNRHSSGSFY